MAKRQLRELQRLMAWSWDSRVDEHPPGEKAMQDFENVLTFQLDSRRRRTTPGSKDAAAAAGSSPAAPQDGSAAKQPRKSADRGLKRTSPAPTPQEAKQARKSGSALRAEPSPAAASPAVQQQQNQQGLPASSAAAKSASAAPSTAADQHHLTATEAAAASPAAAVEATPAVRQQPQQSPAMPASCSAITPAALLAGVEKTPATSAAALFSGPASTGPSEAAVADAQFLPTPAPALLPLAHAPCPPSSMAMPSGAEDEQPAAPADAGAVKSKQPAPRGVLTSHKGQPKQQAEPAPAVAAAEVLQQDQVADDEPAQAAPAVASGPVAGSVSATAALPAALPTEPPAKPAQPISAFSPASPAEPMDTDRPQTAADVGAGTQRAPIAEPSSADAAVASDGHQQASAVTDVAAGAAAPFQAQAAAAAPEVPTPVLQAFAAADQLLYHQPRPSTCPPLFKQQPMQAGEVAAPHRPDTAGTAKSPAGRKRKFPGSGMDKENSSDNHASGSNTPFSLAPRTAEPAPPPPALLSAWKQQQLQQLSASFHSRQRRLLELLSACNRAQQHAAPCVEQRAAAASTSRLGKATAGATAKPPLGPRAAAVAMTRTLGRLKEQQAL